MRRISPTDFRIAGRGTSREINCRIALNLVRDRQPISRADLARLMGVRRTAASRIVDDLLRSGLLFEGPKGESNGGRRPMHLYVETRLQCAVAIDISASRTSIVAMDLLGQPLVEVCSFRTKRKPRAVVQELVRNVRQLLDDNPKLGQCVGIGVAVSGIVDFDGGRLKFSPTLGWRNVDLRGPLEAVIKLPVVVENSMKACVLAQLWSVRGDAPLEGSVAFVNVSDGLGVGIAIDGKLLRGNHNIAGELGHLPLNLGGPRCSCGQAGCWEAYAANRATVARYLGAELSWPGSAELKEASIETIVAGARAGDSRAIGALRETAEYLGRGFAALVKCVDPPRIYVGGEITAAWDLIAPTIKDLLRSQALIPEAAEVEILPVGLDEFPRLRGAAALVSAPPFAAPIVA